MVQIFCLLITVVLPLLVIHQSRKWLLLPSSFLYNLLGASQQGETLTRRLITLHNRLLISGVQLFGPNSNYLCGRQPKGRDVPFGRERTLVMSYPHPRIWQECVRVWSLPCYGWTIALKTSILIPKVSRSDPGWPWWHSLSNLSFQNCAVHGSKDACGNSRKNWLLSY